MESLASFFNNAKAGRPKKNKGGGTKKPKKSGLPGSMEYNQEKWAEARDAQEAALRDMESDKTVKIMARDKILNRTKRSETRELNSRLQDILDAGHRRIQEVVGMHPVQYTGLNYFRLKDGAEYHLDRGVTGPQFLRRQWVIIGIANKK